MHGPYQVIHGGIGHWQAASFHPLFIFQRAYVTKALRADGTAAITLDAVQILFFPES
jgi:hypothetical protein